MNWLGTLWGGRITFTTAMLFALGFVSVFITGGLSGIFLGQPVLDLYLHDTYFVVAHFHLIMGVAAVFGIFAGTFYWFPAMFGRALNERLGKLHFALTFIGIYCLFLPMHVAGISGNPRRYADFTNFEFLKPLFQMHQFMTVAAFVTAFAQLIFLYNLVNTLLTGARVSETGALPEPSPTGRASESAGLYAGLAAITMFFAALLSAWVVRRGISGDWTTTTVHGAIGTSVVPAVLVSVVLMISRKTASRGVLLCAVILACVFVVTTAFGLSATRLDASPAAAFLYVLTGSVVCLATAGVVALARSLKSGDPGLTTANYWHYVNAAWIFLLGFVYIAR